MWPSSGTPASGDPAAFSRAGLNIVRYLGVLQLLTGISALVGLGLAVWPVAAPADPASPFGDDRAVTFVLAGVQLLVAALTILALEPAKRWMADVRAWAAGEAVPGEAHPRRARALSGWLRLGQWLPIVALVLAVPLVWFASERTMDAILADPQLSAQLQPRGGATLSPEVLRGIGRAAAVLSLLTIALPSVVVGAAILGWVRRWMWGATDATLGLPAREPRMRDVAATLGRWFRFLQVVLLFFIAMILAVPLVGSAPGATTVQVVVERFTLLLTFLQLALYVALLRWTTRFLEGVTPRVERTGA